MVNAMECQRFVQNAWKKDLCSNCFKLKEDHSKLPQKIIPKCEWSPLTLAPAQGILKAGLKSSAKHKYHSVSFKSGDSEIIGYGGDEFFSDDEDENYEIEDCKKNGRKESDIDYEDSINEEFQKLTKANTNFNSVPDNLKLEIKRTVATVAPKSDLKLGKPLRDENGNKKTLLVIVEPFDEGSPNRVRSSNQKINNKTSKSNDISEETEKSEIFNSENSAENVNRIARGKNEGVITLKGNEKRDSPIEKYSCSIPKVTFDSAKCNEKSSDATANGPIVIPKCKLKIESISRDIAEVKDNLEYKLPRLNAKFNGNNYANKNNKINDDLNAQLKISDYAKHKDIEIISKEDGDKKLSQIENEENINNSSGINNNENNARKKTITLCRKDHLLLRGDDRKYYSDNFTAKKIELKTPFKITNVSNNSDNNRDTQAIKSCGIDLNNIGFKYKSPFLESSPLHASPTGKYNIPHLSLPLIGPGKDLDIEKLGSRELVGEPDGKADSDESSESNFAKKDVPVSVKQYPLKQYKAPLPKDVKYSATESESNTKEPDSDKYAKNAEMNEPCDSKIGGESCETNDPNFAKNPIETREQSQLFVPGLINPVGDIYNYKYMENASSAHDSSTDRGHVQSQNVFKITSNQDSPPAPHCQGKFASNQPEDKNLVDNSLLNSICVPQRSKHSTNADNQNPQRSFLHAISKTKPVIAVKPNASPLLEADQARELSQYLKTPLRKTHSSGSDVPCETSRTTKRQAPKPPSSPASRTSSISSEDNANDNATKEMTTNEEKRVLVESNPQTNKYSPIDCARYASRRRDSASSGGEVQRAASTPSISKSSISLSFDNFTSPNFHFSSDKKKKFNTATKVRHKLRKMLRFNSRDEVDMLDGVEPTIVPRKRIEIIHPLDLNQNGVQVVKMVAANEANHYANVDFVKRVSDPGIEEKITSASIILPNSPTHATTGRPNKPPPPPRSQSLEQRLTESHCRTVIPLPPKYTETRTYVNIGESRQSLIPMKPQRTASMRDTTKSPLVAKEEISQETSTSEQNANISSSIECDNKSDESNLSGEFSDGTQSSSIVYCGSETESELYFQSSSREDSSESKRRNSGDIIHRSLQDNYEAVVEANHNALLQLLGQVTQSFSESSWSIYSPSSSISWDDLVLDKESLVHSGDWQFYNAKYSQREVVVSICPQNVEYVYPQLPPWTTFNPLHQFFQVIPRDYWNTPTSHSSSKARVTIWNVCQMKSLSLFCNEDYNVGDDERSVLLLQLLRILRILQKLKISTVPWNSFVFCNLQSKEASCISKSCILPVFEINGSTNNSTDRVSLDECAIGMLEKLRLKNDISSLIKQIISKRENESISHAINVIQYWLWGPQDVQFSADRTTTLQRWLDLNRANTLNKLISTRIQYPSMQELHQLMFLVEVDANKLNESSLLLDAHN